MTLLLLFACTETPADVAPGYNDVPYTVEVPEDVPLDFDAAAMTTAIADAVEAARQISASPVFTAYNQVMAQSDEACPSYYEQDGNVYWYAECTTELGSAFSGYSFYYVYDNTDMGDGSIYNGEQLYGVAQMWDADGHELNLGGSAADISITDADGNYTYWYSVAQGAFSWDGPGTEDTWVTPGLAPDLVLIALYYPQYDGHMFQIEGGVSGLGGAYDTVVFDAFTLIDANIGGDCAEEPGGTISVRDANGYWYDVLMDGQMDTESPVRDADCDGCGEVWYQGQSLGQVCGDFTYLNNFEARPW